jgi:hypothetical protein
MGSTHYSGPILVGGGVADESPIHTISPRSNYKTWVEEFKEDVADIAAMETLGWTETAINTPTAATNIVTKETGYLLINPGTKADAGSSLQLNAAPTGAGLATAHQSAGPLTSTTTLMDGRELFFETRIGVSGTTAAWDAKCIFGWIVTDTALMTGATGVPALATGGGIGFHFGEDGVLSYFTQATVVGGYTAVDTGLDITTLGAAATIQWYTLGFRARWVDASGGTGVVHFYRDGNLIGTVTDGLPMQSTQTYSVSFEMLTGPALVNDFYVDYIVTGVSRPGYTIP